jgi:RNA polymerase sigma-70 factor (ECF subfamily)
MPGPDIIDRNGEQAEVDCRRREAAVAVAQAVAGLPAPLREALVLRHYEGLSYEEMGRLLCVPVSTLKSRFCTALEHLKVHLSNLGWSEEDLP